MIPGEIKVKKTEIEINKGHEKTVLSVKNKGDRPIQVGSHYHFYEVNRALDFEREKSYGKRLDIPAGAAVRFEPGDEKDIQLIEYGGKREIYGFYGMVNGPIDESRVYRSEDSNRISEPFATATESDADKNANKESGYNK